MSELRHDRPFLRWLDNYQREQEKGVLAKESVPTGTGKTKPVPRRMQRPLNERAYHRHIDDVEKLSEESQRVLNQLFNATNTLIESRIAYIQTLARPKQVGSKKSTKVTYDGAMAAMRQACIDYHRHCRSEAKDRKSPTQEWLARLRVIMGSGWESFDEFDAILEETRAL